MPRKITYTDKENLVTKEVPAKNKCRAEDLNEIKSVVNDNSDDLTSVITEVTDARGTFNNLDSRIDSIETEVTNARGSFSSLDDRLDDIETEILEDTITGEGENITLNGTAQNAMKKLVIKGKTEQDLLTGKNLLSNSYSDYTTSGTYGYFKLTNIEEDLMISISDKDTSVSMTGIFFGFSGAGADNSLGTQWIMSNGTQISTTLSNSYTSSGITTKLKYFSFYPNNQTTFNKIFTRYNVQIERGTTATSYEPYCRRNSKP